MVRFPTFQGRRAAFALIAAIVPAAASADDPPLCKFERGGLVVAARDAGADGGLGIDIEVADGPLVLTRVGIPTTGRARGCWIADLDADRRFEIILAIDEAGDEVPLRLLRFEWNGALLESPGIAPLDAGQAGLFGGGERVEIRSNHLLRSFASRLQNGRPGPRLHFRYAPETGAWIRLKSLKAPTVADPAR